MSWLLIPAVVFVLFALLSWAIIYTHYWQTPQRRWRNKVLRLATETRRRAQSERNFLRRLDASQERERKNLRHESLLAFLSSISLNELEVFPGIGPATIGKLSQAGYANLASLQHADIHVSGIGRKRLTDIDRAVQELTWQARARIAAGACTEAQTLRTSLDALRSKYDNLKFLPQARLKAAEAVAEKLDELIPLARQLRFLNYWRKNWNDIVPSDILQSELPDLVGIIHPAEQKAEAILQLKEMKTANLQEASKTPLSRHPSEPSGVDRVNDLPAVIAIPDTPIARIEGPTSPAGSESPVKKKRHTVAAAVAAGTQVPSESGLSPLAETNQDIPLIIMELSIQFAFAVARARGPASTSQKTTICDHFFRQYEHDPILSNRARAFCAHYEKSPIDADAGFRRLNELLSIEQRSELLEFAGQILHAADASSDGDAEFLATVARKLGLRSAKEPFSQATPTPFRSEAGPNRQTDGEQQLFPDQCQAILEIDATVPLSAELIRRQFNLLHDKFNPEKVASLGTEFVEMTQKKREEIRIAAQTLMLPFGERLEPPDAKSQPKALRENPDLDAVFGV
jgi:hypothetical protein